MQNARKTVVSVLEIAALALVLLDVGLGFSSAWVRKRLEARKELLASTQRHVFEEQARVARLEKSQALLPGAEGQLKLFQATYLSPRRQAYARAAGLVRELSETSGVQLTSVGYKLDSKHDAPLDRVGLEVSALGAFPGLIDFIHGLETTNGFIVVRNVTFTQGEGGLGMRLAADLYMTR